MGTRIGLNLGCGDKHFVSTDELQWINVDMADNKWAAKPDVECDLRKLTFPDDYADEVHAIHVFEHFQVLEADPVLREWIRVLKPGGKLVLEVPCLNKILQNFADKRDFKYTWLGLYGDQVEGHPEMCHKWCYSRAQLRALMQQVGLKEIEEAMAVYHLPERDMRFTARK